MKKLTKEQQEVWNRLKNGIQPEDIEYVDTIEAITRQWAKSMAEEVDKEILKSIMDAFHESS